MDPNRMPLYICVATIEEIGKEYIPQIWRLRKNYGLKYKVEKILLTGSRTTSLDDACLELEKMAIEHDAQMDDKAKEHLENMRNENKKN